MKTAEVEAIFDQLKVALVPMIRAVGDATAIDDSCLHGHFPWRGQRRFSLSVLGQWGMERSVVAPRPHRASVRDVTVAVRHPPDDELPRGQPARRSCRACTSSGTASTSARSIRAFARTPLAHGVSAAFHESQSRLWENLVGRNIVDVAATSIPTLQEEFPEQFGDVPLETFHRALNKVQPSLRRVDADEVTYCLHIILRFELERDMLAGEVALEDLPEAFDAKMRDYLGLDPPDVVLGVLQDVHWSDMSFGYFPTYALGNVVSVQLWERAEEDLGELDECSSAASSTPLREWLGEHVHRHGRVFTPQELLQRETGSPMDAGPYLAYLERKLGELVSAPVA